MHVCSIFFGYSSVCGKGHSSVCLVLVAQSSLTFIISYLGTLYQSLFCLGTLYQSLLLEVSVGPSTPV
jgi:hypothetical protein